LARSYTFPVTICSYFYVLSRVAAEILLGLDSIRRSKPLVVDVGLVVGSAFAPIVDAERGQSLEARDVDGLSRGDVEGR